ncbi:MAG: ABC transporter substrate-binding protein [Stellaceae bacterium]
MPVAPLRLSGGSSEVAEARLKRRDFLKSTAALAGTASIAGGIRTARSETPRDTLLVLVENGPNSLDIHGVGTTFRSYVACWNLYDRLLTFGRKTLPDGGFSYDHTKIEPELAEDFTLSPDGMSVTFKLRRDATFHDGAPVTAEDVKWSLDRAVTVGGFPTFQMAAGSLKKPEQFIVLDDHTIRIDFLHKDKLTLPDLAVVVPAIFNSKLARSHATEKDPWALEWMKTNDAGGGAYKLERWVSGQETAFIRFDEWKSGPLPKIRRVVLREVPAAGNRRALMERGDADLSIDMPFKDAAEIKKSGVYRVVGTPVENSLQYVGLVTKMKPFDDVRVRQAIAWAVPYEEIYKSVVYDICIPMSGGPTDAPKTAAWPQAFPYKHDIEKAKALLSEAGLAGGFETTISIDLGDATQSEPTAVLLQNSLAELGVKTRIEKIPGANFRNAMLEKNRPIHVASFGGWLNYPDYYFFWGYHGQNALFDTMSYQNPAMDKLIDAARFEADPEAYDDDVKKFIRIAMEDVPRIPLYQQILVVGMQKNIQGYTYWFHRQLDFRQLEKS